MNLQSEIGAAITIIAVAFGVAIKTLKFMGVETTVNHKRQEASKVS